MVILRVLFVGTNQQIDLTVNRMDSGCSQMNSSGGGGEPEMGGCTSPFISDSSNESGYELGKFCMRLNLKAANTFFDHPPDNK